MTTRKIYVACLSSYNAGRLVGTHIDMDDVLDADDLAARCQAAVAPTGEEYAIHDHEGWFGLLSGEHPDLAKLYELHEELTGFEQSHGKEAIIAAIAICDAGELPMAMDAFCGAYDKAGDYAYEIAEQGNELDGIPERYRNNIDWEAIERDDELNRTISVSTVNGTRYIFGQW